MSGFYLGKPQMIIYAKLQNSRVRHQYGIFRGKSQTSFSRNTTRAGSKEGRLHSQATLFFSYFFCQLVSVSRKKVSENALLISISLRVRQCLIGRK